jgi:hypothetical protein
VSTAPSRRPVERGHDGLDVVHASAPRAAAHLLERRPEARVGRKLRIGPEVGARSPRREHARALVGAERASAVADQIDRPLEPMTIDHDLDEIAVLDLADRAAGERLRAGVSDARSGRDAGEARVGQHRHALSPRRRSPVVQSA